MRKLSLKIVSMTVVVLLASFFVVPSIIMAASDTSGFVKHVYEQVLDREPSQSEINIWVDRFNDGSASAYTLVNAAVLGIEKGSEVNALDNKDYIYLLYKNLFQRTPDIDGLNAWNSRMQSGKGKSEVLQGFIVSQEFANLCSKFNVKPYLSKEIDNKNISALNSIGSSSGTSADIVVPQETAPSASSNVSSPTPDTTPPPPSLPSGHKDIGSKVCGSCHAV